MRECRASSQVAAVNGSPTTSAVSPLAVSSVRNHRLVVVDEHDWSRRFSPTRFGEAPDAADTKGKMENALAPD